MGITYTNEDARMKILLSILNPASNAEGKKMMPVLKTENGMMSFQLYPNSNENLGFVQYLDVYGRTCLTTGSSCDQLFTLIASGAERVDLFDINPLAQDFYELKKQVILRLPRVAGHVFLLCHPQNRDFLHKGLYYSKIDQHLSPFEQSFWRRVVESPNKMDLFRLDRQILSAPYYLFNRDNFKSVRENLKTCKVDFYELPLSHIRTIEHNDYEIVLLSNVIDWYKSTDRFFDHLCEILPRTSQDAKIQIGYLWGELNENSNQEKINAGRERFGEAVITLPKTGWWGHHSVFLNKAELTNEQVKKLYADAVQSLSAKINRQNKTASLSNASDENTNLFTGDQTDQVESDTKQITPDGE